jgi:hypothetical protein
MAVKKTGPWPKSQFFVGCDLGRQHDYTAITITEKLVEPLTDWTSLRPVEVAPPRYVVKYIQRCELGTDYPTIVEDLAALMRRPPLCQPASKCTEQTKLIFDETGVGAPVGDLLRKSGISPRPVGIVITAGHGASRTRDGWRVSKLQIVSVLSALLHCGRLKISAQLAESRALIDELQNFRVTYTEAANVQFGARTNRHDDIILSLGVGVWFAERGGGSGWRENITVYADDNPNEFLI